MVAVAGRDGREPFERVDGNEPEPLLERRCERLYPLSSILPRGSLDGVEHGLTVLVATRLNPGSVHRQVYGTSVDRFSTCDRGRGGGSYRPAYSDTAVLVIARMAFSARGNPM